MNCIINKLGVLSDDDKSFITSDDAKKYVSMLKCDPKTSKDYQNEL